MTIVAPDSAPPPPLINNERNRFWQNNEGDFFSLSFLLQKVLQVLAGRGALPKNIIELQLSQYEPKKVVFN